MWTYNGNPVEVPQATGIFSKLRSPEGERVVQASLDTMARDERRNGDWPWSNDPAQALIYTVELGDSVSVATNLVRLKPGEQRIWATRKADWRRQVNLPHVQRLSREWPRVRTITIHLTGSPWLPKLIHAYPGEERPPLPGTDLFRSYDGRQDEALAFWRTHAYLYYPDSVQRISQWAPVWFLS